MVTLLNAIYKVNATRHIKINGDQTAQKIYKYKKEEKINLLFFMCYENKSKTTH